MKQKKLRGYVLPTVYVLILMLIFGSVSIVSTILAKNPSYLYGINILKNDISTPVIATNNTSTPTIIKPYTSDKVIVDKHFYDLKSNEETQENSLIYFKDTYMKNTGILYKSDEEFSSIMVLDGTVLNIKTDEILGNVVEIEHNSNLRTIYYSLDKIDVKVGDFLSQGETIGTSGKNNLTTNPHNLLFEVYYNGSLINPEEFYNMNPGTLN